MKNTIINAMKNLIFALFLLASVYPAWADVSAFLNQNSFYEGDPVTLTIEARGDMSGKPDFTPLHQDFRLLGTSTSTQISIHNGQNMSKKSWTIQLQPLRKGKLQIPPIRVGNHKTAPLAFEIRDISPEAKRETSKHIFVESSVDVAGKKPYVQQQIPYTVKLFYDSSMQSGQIYSPSVENAVVEQLGDDRRYKIVRLGKKYSVVEKHFVISPEKSGKLHIPATTVKGRISIPQQRPKGQANQPNRQRGNTDFMNRFFSNSPFDNDPFFKDFGGSFFSGRSRTPGKPFTVSSKSVDVDVLPVPSEFKGKQWLPAEEVIVEDSWAKSAPQLRVGEPVTRTLRFQVKGLAGSQIPQIEIPKPDNMRIYPEQAKSETRTDGKTVYGLSEMNITYIPDAAGKVSIPELKLDWWNVVSKKQQTFRLPKRYLNVAPGVAGSSANRSVQSTVASQANAVSGTAEKVKAPSAGSADKSSTGRFAKWSGLFLLALVLAGLGYFYTKRQTQINTNTTDRNKKNASGHKQKMSREALSSKKIESIKKALQQACERNDKHAAAKHLLALADASWYGNNPPQNLASLASLVSQGREQILALERSLYAPATPEEQWQGPELWKVVKDGIKTRTKKVKKQAEGLKPLYPG